MKILRVFVFFMFVLETSCVGAERKDCHFSESVRQALVSGEYEALTPVLNFPVDVLIGGAKTKIYTAADLKQISKWVFTEDFAKVVSEASSCELVELFGIKDGEFKLKSLVYKTDAVDLRYSKSGITSAKKLYEFVDTVQILILSKDYLSLSKLFHYPFYIDVNGKKTEVASKDDFILYKEYIVTDRFTDLISNISKTRNFNEHLNGLMLNERGDYWIVEIYDNLLLQPVEPFYK